MHDTRFDPLTTVPMSVREIAQIFGVTPNAIRDRLRRLEITPHVRGHQRRTTRIFLHPTRY